jgi:hypothetical protein
VTAAYTARARTLVPKMMFWALAGVTFSAAKIVSCNKNFFFHGLPSKLLQLFYFRGLAVILKLSFENCAIIKISFILIEKTFDF